MLELKCANPNCNKVIYIQIDPLHVPLKQKSKSQKDYCSVACVNFSAGNVTCVEGEPCDNIEGEPI